MFPKRCIKFLQTNSLRESFLRKRLPNGLSPGRAFGWSNQIRISQESVFDTRLNPLDVEAVKRRLTCGCIYNGKRNSFGIPEIRKYVLNTPVIANRNIPRSIINRKWTRVARGPKRGIRIKYLFPDARKPSTLFFRTIGIVDDLKVLTPTLVLGTMLVSDNSFISSPLDISQMLLEKKWRRCAMANEIH